MDPRNGFSSNNSTSTAGRLWTLLLKWVLTLTSVRWMFRPRKYCYPQCRRCKRLALPFANAIQYPDAGSHVLPTDHTISLPRQLHEYHIKDALLRVKGVGDVFTRADDFSMRVCYRQINWLSSTHSQCVINALQEQNVQIAAGSVGAPPQRSVQHLNIPY